MCVWINYEFLLCIMFFSCTFWLRNINDEFSINTEIRTMTTILFLTDALYMACIIYFYDSVFVVLGFCQYFQVFLSLSLLFVTSVRPVYKSY